MAAWEHTISGELLFPHAITSTSCLTVNCSLCFQPVNSSAQIVSSSEETAPLDKEVLSRFTADMFASCLSLLADVPETVGHVCDLMAVASKRNGDEWRDGTLNALFRQVGSMAAAAVLSLCCCCPVTLSN